MHNDRIRQQKQKEKAGRLKTAKRWVGTKWILLAFAFSVYLMYIVVQARQIQNFEQAYAMRAIEQVMARYGASDSIIVPNRGMITDRYLQPLAESFIHYNVFVDARILNQRAQSDPDTAPIQLIFFEDQQRILTEFFGISEEYLQHILTHDTNQYFIEWSVPFSRRLQFDEWLQSNRLVARDIHFQELTQRNYIYGHIAAPILGFNHGYWWGIESRFNHLLTGYEGRNMTVFGQDGNISTDRIPATHGASVVTTLDFDIQRFAEDLVLRWARQAQARYGSVIVMNPHNGEIFAMAQYPSFDANQPSNIDLLTTQQTENLSELDPTSQEFFNHLYRIWTNFNVSGTHEPGSVYKSITAAKALDAGVITHNQMFYCTGYKMVAGHQIRCWVHSFPQRRHGLINLTEAIAFSCNVAHMEIAEALGRELFWQYQRDFGFGVPTGIDLPAENAGMVFSVPELNASELATSSFGQRFTSTPIQMISSFAPLINGGSVVRPHVVQQVIGPDGEVIFAQNTDAQRRVIAPDVADWMRNAMSYTVTVGTGRNAAINGFPQGGKTATGEQGLQILPSGEDNPNFTWSISYIGYFPLDNPQYLVMTLLHDVPPAIYNAGFTSVVPMYREMMQHIINLRNIPQSGTGLASSHAASNENIVVDFVGMGVQQAIDTANVFGHSFNFINSGSVVASQFPPAGATVTGNVTMILTLQNNEDHTIFAVPNVVGLPIEAATRVLEQAGFNARVRFGDEFDAEGETDFVAYSQIPQGLSLPQGTDIIIIAQPR